MYVEGSVSRRDWVGPRVFNDGFAMVPLANGRREWRPDKRARDKEKKGFHRGKGRRASLGRKKKKRVGKLVEREMRVQSKLP